MMPVTFRFRGNRRFRQEPARPVWFSPGKQANLPLDQQIAAKTAFKEQNSAAICCQKSSL